MKINDTEKWSLNPVTRGYLLAVMLIAVLATGAFSALNSALKDSENTALIVNMAGKQRMLSQKIALEIHNVKHHKTLDNQEALLQTLKELRYIAEEMAMANKKLSSGQLTNTDFMPPSESLSELYFGDMNLYQRVYDYTSLAKSINRLTTQDQLLIVIETVDRLSELLLNDLDKVVTQYQMEGEARLVFLQRMETTIWLVTLLALILEILFIFRPMARRVAKGVEIEQNFVVQLRDQVELRTIKLEKANQKLANVASHDPLTGIKNRLTFEADLEELFVGFSHHNQSFAVVIVDLDWFKKVNDQFGHDYGDFVLKSFANLIKNNIREYDEIYRIGGEEFVLLINRISFSELLIKLEELKEMIKHHDFSFEDKSYALTASFGVYHSSLFTLDNYKEALKVADKALYEAKAFGRNRINIASEQAANKRLSAVVKKVNLTFSDSSLNHLLSVDKDIESLLGVSAQTLLNDEIEFLDLIYAADCDLIETIQNELDKQLKISKTIRLKTQQNKVIIVRLEALQDSNGVNVEIQSATELAKKLSDDILVYNFHAMMDNTNDFIYFKDRNHVFTAGSQSLVDITSIESREDLVGKIDYEVFSQALADEYFILEKEVFNGEVSVAQKFQPYEDNEGNKGWVDNRKYPIKNFKGEIIGLFGIARIISDQEYRKAMQETIDV